MRYIKKVLIAVGLGILLLISGCGDGSLNNKMVNLKNERKNLKLACQLDKNEIALKNSRYQIFPHHTNKRWKNNIVKWWYNPTHQAYSTSEALAAIENAMQQWENVCGIKFSYQGLTNQNLSNYQNSKFVIGWIDDYTIRQWQGIDDVAAAGPSWSNRQYISDAEIYINYEEFEVVTDITKYNPHSLNEFQGLMAHELGHVIGIAHSDVEGAVMSGKSAGTQYIPWSERTILTDDDIKAARFLYPTNIKYQYHLTISDGQRIGSSWSTNDTPSKYRENSYAKMFDFTLYNRSKVQISLISSVDTYLYLIDSSGNILDQNDDFDGRNSKIETTLYSGVYTIIATTYSPYQTGSFTVGYKILQDDKPQKPKKDEPNTSISNLKVSSITDHSAMISWDGDPSVQTWVYVHAPYNSTGSKHTTRNGRYTYPSLASGITFTVYIQDDNGNTLSTDFTTRVSGDEPPRLQPQPSVSQYYGAFAYSNQTQRWGYTWRYTTEQQARRSAISYCGRSDCTILQVISDNECMAYAASSNHGGYWQVHSSKNMARNLALQACNNAYYDCSLEFSFCADGR